MAEYHSASRTWMGTLTLNPEAVANTLHLLRVSLAKQGVDYDALEEAERFQLFDGVIYGEFQNRLKVLRKNTQVPVRYLAVTEEHASGLPHWHVLLHESDPEKRLRYDGDLRPFWLLGFQKWKLVDDTKAASYVCKYLSKSIKARVRASLRYGGIPSAELPPEAKEREERRKRKTERETSPPKHEK